MASSPNPTTTQLTVMTEKTRMKRIDISDAVGALTFSSRHRPIMSMDIDVSHLQSGVYLVHVFFEDGTGAVERFIKAN
jgi:hypothetical protein